MNTIAVPPGEAPGGVGLYVFCFSRAEACAAAAAGPGLAEGGPLRTFAYGAVAALCCEVPLADWVGSSGETNLRNLAWLGPRALRHEEVIERAMAASPVLPVRFGCLFSSAERLQELLARAEGRIASFLEDATEWEEWSLKGTVDMAACLEVARAEERCLATLPESPGARYLVEKKLEQRASGRARAWMKEALAEIAREIDGVALERRPAGSIAPGAGTEGREVLLHWALRLPRGAEPELGERLRALEARLSARGLVLEARGPWPPYAFAPRLDEDQ